MPSLHWDIETRSAADLNKLGARRYAADPTTTVLCIAYAVDDEEPAIWTPGLPVPQPFIEAAADEDWRIIAHNDAFEREIEAQILHPRYGWPQIPLARRRCSMALARANGLPGGLKEAAALLGLVNQKDQAGHLLMLELSCAGKPLDPAKLELLFAYCKQDVRSERELCGRLPPLPPEEQKVWELDQTINARGFAVDLKFAQAARKIAAEEKEDINARITALTDGAITTANQRDKILNYVRERGHAPKNLGKRSVAQMLAHDPDAETREILELRRAGGRSSVAKFRTVIADADADSRVRDTFRYHGSHTGRWAGRSFQPQNLPKVKIADVGAAADAVMSGDHERVRSLKGGDTLSIITNVVRNVIVAKPGHVLIGADFAAIESRVLGWLADEIWKLNTYREFDRTGDPRLEPYCVIASRMLRREVTPEDEAGRQHGKTADLALGFGGSVGAWRKFMPDDPRSDEQIKRESVDTFRDAHPATRKFWKGIEGLFKICVRYGEPRTFGRITAEMADGALRLALPSGRCLVYREARLGPGKFENSVDLHFHNGYRAAQAWFGTIVENIVQGVARDLLAAAMLRLEAAGSPVVLHCHDEAVCEVAEDQVDEARFLELMTTLPTWAEGLPIAAKTWINRHYAKSKPAPKVAPSLSTEPHEITHGRPSCAVEPHDPTTGNLQFGDACESTPTIMPLADLIGEPLIDGKIKCPFHADGTPSLHIYDDHYHCYACNAHGDHIDWLMLIEEMDRDTAVRVLGSWDGQIARPRAADEEARRASTLAYALRLWEAARPIAGTLAAQYLTERRRIDLTALPDTALRFHPHCPFGPGAEHPCLLALMRDATTDAPTGIHRIALTPDANKIDRRMLGSSGVVKLWPAAAQLVVGEGIETTLAAATRISHHGAPLCPAWSAVSGGALARLPVVAGVERLLILVDHDLNGQGQANAAQCADRWSRAGRSVIQLKPKHPGDDFNDVIMREAVS
jgi:hypothetical protein